MPSLFVGPSYSLATYKASSQRSVNLYLVGMETPSKAPFILDAVPGLTLFAELGAEIRGSLRADGRCFVVAGYTLYEVDANGAKTARGTLNTGQGPVSMAWGTTQLVIVDGVSGYVLTLATNAAAQIIDGDFYGSTTVAYLDGFFLFARPDSQQFFISAIDDASDIDGLDFASAESSPDGLVAVMVDHRQVLLFGEYTIEVWNNFGGDFPFQRNNGASIEVGCMAAHSVRQIDNGVMFLGQDRNGSGIVYRLMDTQQAVRVSTQAVEQALSEGNLSEAVAYVYQERGLTFYAINAPGLSATWVYEVSTGTWHERCDLDGQGQFTPLRVKHHVFAFGKHLMGGDDGNLYELDRTAYTFGATERVCERTSPHTAGPDLGMLSFGAFVLDATTGEAPQGVDPVVSLSWSNDGGASFGNPVSRSLGKVGERFPRLTWRRLGIARNRVWRLRFSDNAPFSIINAEVV